MEGYEQIYKYQVAVTLSESGAEWKFCVQTESGSQYELAVKNSADIPILVGMVSTDTKVYFDPKTGMVSSGWNLSGTEARG